MDRRRPEQRIYDAISNIKKGRVATISDIAKEAHVRDEREVIRTLQSHAKPEDLPSHRVVDEKGGLLPTRFRSQRRRQYSTLRREKIYPKGRSHNVDLDSKRYDFKKKR